MMFDNVTCLIVSLQLTCLSCSWFVHSSDDKVVSVNDTDKLVAALQSEGNKNVQYRRHDVSLDPSAKGIHVHQIYFTHNL